MVNDEPKFKIVINRQIADDQRKVIDTLLHEMIHLEHQILTMEGKAPIDNVHGGHDSFFERRMKEISRDGYNVDKVLNEADYLNVPVKSRFIDILGLHLISSRIKD